MWSQYKIGHFLDHPVYDVCKAEHHNLLYEFIVV